MSNYVRMVENEQERFEDFLKVMDERMKREELILSTSPCKKVVNAIRYARAVNSTLDSNLEKSVSLLGQDFEQEIRRIVDIQREALQENPQTFRKYSSSLRGFTRKQFRRRLKETLESQQRTEELRRTKTRFSLPELSSEHSSNSRLTRRSHNFLWFLNTSKQSETIYLPPI